MTSEYIRERITQLRMQKGVSEYKMSYDLGHSRGYINNISSGKTLPSMAEFLVICDYFDITPAQFFQADVSNPNAANALWNEITKLRPSDLLLIQAIVERMNDSGR